MFYFTSLFYKRELTVSVLALFLPTMGLGFFSITTEQQQQPYTFTPEQHQQSYTFTPEQQQPYTFTPEKQQQQYTFFPDQHEIQWKTEEPYYGILHNTTRCDPVLGSSCV
jgi:type IV secretory pathway VirB9-like protein